MAEFRGFTPKKPFITVGKLNYDPNKIIGIGSFGTVFIGSYTSSSSVFPFWGSRKQPVAVKRVQRSHIDENSFRQEVELMRIAGDHPNILRWFCTEMNDDFLFVATERCVGTLQDYVEGTYKESRFMGEKEILNQVAHGLNHLHSLNVIHRDIKPKNILIFAPEGEGTRPQIKLADFGLCKVPKADKEDFTNTNVTNPSGTKGWMAPEVFKEERIDFKVDVWALGCIFAYTLSSGKHPYGDDLKRIIRIIQGKPLVLAQADLKKVSIKEAGVAFELIKSMLEVEPEKRPTVTDVLDSVLFPLFDPDKTEQFLEHCLSFEESITDDKISQFKTLLKDEAVDVNATTRNGWTPLHVLFIFYNNDDLIELVKLLVLRGANVNATTPGGNIPLHTLCGIYEHYNLINIVQVMIENGAHINLKNGEGFTPLHFLCAHYRNENLIYIVQVMIENGVEVNAKTLRNETPLHFLCANFDKGNLFKIAQLLIQNGAEVNVETLDGKSPLHLLCRYCENDQLIKTARLLIDNGVDVSAKTQKGKTPLHFLCKYYENDNLFDLVWLLVQKGADISAKTVEYGMTPLHLICQNYRNDNLIDLVHFFIEKNADVNAANLWNTTPLYFLCSNYKNKNLIYIVQILVENGANVNAKRKYNKKKTPLHLLCENYKNDNLIDVVRYFIDNGADVNAKTIFDMNPLHVLCANYKSEKLMDVVRYFVEKGVDTSAKDFFGQTPVSILNKKGLCL